jgi:hypothetical protein
LPPPPPLPPLLLPPLEPPLPPLPPLPLPPLPLPPLPLPLPPLPLALPLPPLPPPPTAAAAALPPLLVIGIPSMRRQGDADYVLRTLHYLLSQTVTNGTGLLAPGGQGASDVPGPHPLRIRVLAMDNTRQPGAHVAFEAAAARYCRGAAGAGGAGAEALGPCTPAQALGHALLRAPRSALTLAWNGQPRLQDGEDAGDDNFPGARVRAQSRDVVALLQLAHALHASDGSGAGGAEGAMAAYMFLEDDFRVCAQGLRALALGLARAGALHPGSAPEAPAWNALRVSYGLNGGILRGEDVPVFGGYLARHLARRPPDHLLVEWFAGERPESAEHKRGRPHAAFRYNVLEHFGASSSLRGKAAPLYAVCYAELNEGVVFEVEAFKAAQCAHDVVWPCWARGDGRYGALVREGGSGELDTAGIDFGALAAAGVADSVQKYAM